MTDDTIKVLIADDHLPMRMGLKLLLNEDPTIRCVGEAVTGPEIIPLVVETRPDVLLLDVSMPDLDVVPFIERVRRDYPFLEILVVTSYDDAGLVSSLLKAGVRGYMLKDEIDESNHPLAYAVRQVFQGKPYLSRKAVEGTLNELRRDSADSHGVENLSEREAEVLLLASKGLTNRQIGQALNISEITARNHLSNIYAKLNVSNRADAVRYALENNLLEGGNRTSSGG